CRAVQSIRVGSVSGSAHPSVTPTVSTSGAVYVLSLVMLVAFRGGRPLRQGATEGPPVQGLGLGLGVTSAVQPSGTSPAGSRARNLSASASYSRARSAQRGPVVAGVSSAMSVRNPARDRRAVTIDRTSY